MRGVRTVLVLGIVTLVAVGAVLFVERGPDTTEPGDAIVFPALLERVNAVARVRVTGNEGAFTLARDGDAWVVEEKERYPGDPDRVHKLLIGAAGMKRVEPKTSNPERYPKLWLEDPTGKDARSVRLVLEDASGAVLSDWVLGDRRPSKSDASRTELYIRVADDPQAWLVEGSVPGGGKIIAWLDRVVARIDRERLRTAEVSHTDGAMVAVSKEVPADGDFVLRDVPEGRETDSQYRVNDIGRFLEDLRFEDVAPASSLDFAGSADKRLEITTFDGLRVRVDSVMREGDAWVQLRAEVDEGLVEKTAGADAGASDAESGTEPSDTSSGALRPLDEVRTEAERMNARWQGWAYELPSFKRDYIAKRIDELTRAIEEKDEGTGGGDS
jgi:hypothetical protein